MCRGVTGDLSEGVQPVGILNLRNAASIEGLSSTTPPMQAPSLLPRDLRRVSDKGWADNRLLHR
jgi:hypothetical protein